MAKSKEQKNKLIDYLKLSFTDKKAAILVDYKGLTVKEIESLRNQLSDQGIKFSVVKNSLLKIALDEQKLEIDKELLERPLAISFSDDEVIASKKIVESAKHAEALEILGGIIDKKFVSEGVIRELATLPGREELYAKLVGTLNAPVAGIVNVLAGNIRNLVNVLYNYKEAIS